MSCCVWMLLITFLALMAGVYKLPFTCAGAAEHFDDCSAYVSGRYGENTKDSFNSLGAHLFRFTKY